MPAERPIVEVTWEDAAAMDRWSTTDPAPTTVLQQTVGRLLERTNERLIVAGGRIPELGVYRHIDVIPASLVRKVRRLR